MKNEKGQSIFEFLIFLPFMVILFISLVKIQGAINASINQQKSARGYFFGLLRNNSMLADRADITNLMGGSVGIKNYGISVLGWRDYSEGGGDGESGFNPVSACFKLSGLGLNDNADNNCEDSVPTGTVTLKNIRVYTAFGLCSANFSNDSAEILYNPLLSTNSGACSNN